MARSELLATSNSALQNHLELLDRDAHLRRFRALVSDFLTEKSRR